MLLFFEISDSTKVTSTCIGTAYKMENVITSPNFPSHYPSSSNCQWLIVSQEGRRLRIRFKFFYTEHIYDTLSIFDGANQTAYHLGTFTGLSLPPNITSSFDSLFLWFISDNYQERTGFEIEYLSFDGGITHFQY